MRDPAGGVLRTARDRGVVRTCSGRRPVRDHVSLLGREHGRRAGVERLGRNDRPGSSAHDVLGGAQPSRPRGAARRLAGGRRGAALLRAAASHGSPGLRCTVRRGRALPRRFGALLGKHPGRSRPATGTGLGNARGDRASRQRRNRSLVAFRAGAASRGASRGALLHALHAAATASALHGVCHSARRVLRRQDHQHAARGPRRTPSRCAAFAASRCSGHRALAGPLARVVIAALAHRGERALGRRLGDLRTVALFVGVRDHRGHRAHECARGLQRRECIRDRRRCGTRWDSLAAWRHLRAGVRAVVDPARSDPATRSAAPRDRFRPHAPELDVRGHRAPGFGGLSGTAGTTGATGAGRTRFGLPRTSRFGPRWHCTHRARLGSRSNNRS